MQYISLKKIILQAALSKSPKACLTTDTGNLNVKKKKFCSYKIAGIKL
jgi:hypothetical protein